MTASYEDTRTQSSQPSGTSVTEQMFDRAARYASVAGTGKHGGLTLCITPTSCFAEPVHLLQADHHRANLSAAGGAGGSTSFAALQGADAAWAKAKAQKVISNFAVLAVQLAQSGPSNPLLTL